MTTQRIAEISARVDASSDRVEIERIGVCECPMCDGEGSVEVADITVDGFVSAVQCYGIGDAVRRNAEFYSKAREDVVWLLDETKRSRAILRDLLDAFFDMSPLEYAASRKLPYMSDAIGEEILDKAREITAGK